MYFTCEKDMSFGGQRMDCYELNCVSPEFMFEVPYLNIGSLQI